MIRTCVVVGCSGPHLALGYCEPHYRRFKRWGDPLAGQWWRGLTVEERFWAKVEKPLDPDGCWLWTGSRRGRPPNQYGSVWDGTYRSPRHPNHIGAHQFSWKLHRGPIPAGMEVCHSCDTPLCCNPRHLFLGSHGDNMRDSSSKGRQGVNVGALNGRAKLTAEFVEQIRAESTGRYGEVSDFARRFGVSSATVSKILKRQIW